MHLQALASSILLLSSVAVAHPGHDLTEEILERRSFKNSVRRASLSHCAEKLKARGVQARNLERRAATAALARLSRGVSTRDADSALGESHNKTSLGYSENTSISELFSGNASCVLTPEVTQGPYCMSTPSMPLMFLKLTAGADVGGERIRKNVTDGQAGVDITLDYQVIDVDTCDPVPNVYIEIWHCNSTGVYSGVVANGNGDSSDETNINNTFLRGIQKTDSDGVAQFDSLFPGHYTGRATHIHVMVHTNATELSNQTLGNQVYASHVGQAFFDQDLITAVEKVEPYASNTQPLTENSGDSILSEEADTTDPLMAYTLLGDSVADGLFAWLAFGINTSYVNEVQPASFYYESGGVENPNGGFGGPGGNGGGGPPPSGAPGGRPGGSNGTGTSGGIASPTAISMGNRYTIGAVTFSLVGLLLPLLWL
ncbi:hypothetical protein MHUMG1_02899 [Metarhizium humberi]|uniref:Intradiol ring-cleavage dioxygenases domain-containing protein n=1 Tax=Metarhizium humberi TaxID=2596975 RepID=A0A9P8S981_9HYPO|nr:hypothetical protein MHUMG1_02899 [Metarhizium humberi]